MNARVSRRELLTGLFQPARRQRPPVAPQPNRTPRAALPQIQPWLCLAYRGQGCSTCGEHCPIPDAITRTDGRPQIDPNLCDQCGRCADVCPAPLNAILLPQRARS